MSREAFVNGEYTEYINSKVHIEDRGYQFADGVYEVFAVLNSKIVDYEGHVKRLYRSLKELNIASPIQRRSYKFHKAISTKKSCCIWYRNYISWC